MGCSVTKKWWMLNQPNMENGDLTIGKWQFNQEKMGFNGIYS